MTLLSILIPSVPDRVDKLRNVLDVLSRQIINGVEIIVNMDNREVTLGAKENRLLKSAKGKYVVFVDDDDMVKENYIEKIMEGINKDVDIVQIQTEYYEDDIYKALITFHIGQKWTNKNDTYFLRSCAKFCPHKREIAMQVMFDDINFIEDRPYAEGIDKICKTEHLIDCPVYEYRFVINKNVL